MEQLSLEYIAGLFDGEGHVSITWSTRTHRNSTSKDPKLSVNITNTHLPVLELVQIQFGGTIHTVKKQKEHYLQVYVLTFNVTQSKIFLNRLLPFLVIKKNQALVALKFSNTVYKRGKKKVSEEERIIREECMLGLKELKNTSWIQNRQLVSEWNG